MLISWGSVSGQQDDCQLWLRDPRNSSLSRQHTLGRGQGQHLLQGLVPGRNYSVSLSCVAGPYWSSSKPLTVPVGGYALPWGWGERRGGRGRSAWVVSRLDQSLGVNKGMRSLHAGR